MTEDQRLQAIYDSLIRERLPRRLGVVQGDIVVRRPRLFDQTDREPDYERAESDALRDLVGPGDHVLLLGGGFGVTTVVAARAAGPEGRITVYEAVPDMASLVHEAVEINDPPASVNIHTAAVGQVTPSSRESFGGASNTVPVSELPDADVWSLDIEGAEDSVLSQARDAGLLPDRVVCEVHCGRTDEETVVSVLTDVDRRERPTNSDSEWIAVRGGNS